MKAHAPLVGLLALVASPGCGHDLGSALDRLMEARRVTAELLVQFTKAADASNRVVMADTDEIAAAFAHEAAQATQEAVREAESLKAIVASLGYAPEARLLDAFDSQFKAYLALDRSILELAVENTNVKARRLSFGPARAAADAVKASLDPVVASVKAEDAWHARALAATAVAAVREIQMLQAPHIAEADDAAMAGMERQMATSESAAKDALEQLSSLIEPASQPMLASATSALDRFFGLNTELVTLSRRNTNVRSLELSLGGKRVLTASCEEGLRAVQEALAKRSLGPTR